MLPMLPTYPHSRFSNKIQLKEIKTAVEYLKFLFVFYIKEYIFIVICFMHFALWSENYSYHSKRVSFGPQWLLLAMLLEIIF